MRIGILEDDRLLCQALEIALQEAGYETVSAHTKKEALGLFDGKEDLLLIDIGLPDGDGIRLYHQICREGKAIHVYGELELYPERKQVFLRGEEISLHGGFLLAKRMEPGLLMEISLPAEKDQPLNMKKGTGLS